MKVCTIIASYNFEKWIEPCLKSLRNSSLATQVVVIDNNSNDNTCEIIFEQYPEVVLIQNSNNLGFGRANNEGFKYAIEHGYDYVFLLNQDAWINDDMLCRLIDASKNNPDYGIISPIHLNGDGDKLDFGFSTYSSLKNKEHAESVLNEITECEFINAAMWLIPVSVLNSVGGFAPIFPHYGEDVDYAHRMRYFKYRIGYVKGAYACHDREHRVVEREKYFYTEYIYFLTEAVNIGYSCFKGFGYSVLAAIKKSLQSLVSGRVSDSFKYLSISFKLLSKMPSILATRSKSKNDTAAYL